MLIIASSITDLYLVIYTQPTVVPERCHPYTLIRKLNIIINTHLPGYIILGDASICNNVAQALKTIKKLKLLHFACSVAVTTELTASYLSPFVLVELSVQYN